MKPLRLFCLQLCFISTHQLIQPSSFGTLRTSSTLVCRASSVPVSTRTTIATTPLISSLFMSSTPMSTTSKNSASPSPKKQKTAAGVTKDLQPQPLFSFFEALSSIPRPSKHEGEVLDYLKKIATDRNLQWQQDAAGNLVIRKPGINGGEKAAPVVLQAHIDMVTEKNSNSQHDFFTQGIKLKVEGDWLRADGTTLGADNGMGVAAALALLDLEAGTFQKALPPLECLFTVDEETGLNGAFALDGSMLKGRRMMNLDTEEWGVVYVGCAGGGSSDISLAVEIEETDVSNKVAVRVDLQGLMGGHSGINIHEDRANAVQQLATTVLDLREACPALQVVSFNGGDKHNAIPREASALLLLPADYSMDDIKAVVVQREHQLKSEFGPFEKKLSLTVTSAHAEVAKAVSVTSKVAVLTEQSFAQLLDLLQLLPHGVIKKSHQLKNLVETSSNVARVRCNATGISEGGGGSTPNTVKVLCSTRSSLSHALEITRRKIAAVCRLCGASIIQSESYPGWQPDNQSSLLAVAKEVMGKIMDKEADVLALHAGLECGVILEKVPDMEIISFGPTIEGAHSPDERCRISTVGPFWTMIVNMLENLAATSA